LALYYINNYLLVWLIGKYIVNLTMVFILNKTSTIANTFLAELRDVNIQQDKLRFRRNQEKLGEILAYEISKTLKYTEKEIQTPLGIASVNMPEEEPVLCTILRAGLPFHQGFMNFYDKSPSAFATAYRKIKKNGTFIINVDHISSPDMDNKILIICDAMLATGQSMVQVCKELIATYAIKEIHIAAIIASTEGVAHVRANLPKARLWLGAVDEEMTSKAYIVPGLGDAGDLSFGEKM
jgi:uracil phosphoribosyltransferase